jgi:DNA-binding NtrC family response regulator
MEGAIMSERLPAVLPYPPETAEGVVTASILCMHDDPAVAASLEHTLTRAGYRAVLVSSLDEAVRVVARSPIDLIIVNDRIPGFTGLDMLATPEKEGHRIPVIMVTGESSMEHAGADEWSGAVDYLTEPIGLEILGITVRRVLELGRLRRENETFRRELVRLRGKDTPVGDSEPYRRTMELVATVATWRAPVLLHGESGTGKVLFGRAIHDQGPRAHAPFITVNCAALPEELVDSALFGHQESGSVVRSAGAFEQAHGGTLLLDEISEMRLGLQARLLAVIQEPLEADVRLIATTNRDLAAEVAAGRFSADLYRRLNELPIRVPSLRERVEDIPRLVRHFARRAAELQGNRPPTIAPEALDVLQRYPWPANVRELANAVDRAVLLCRDDMLQPGDFDRQIREAAAHPRRPAMVAELAGPGAVMVDYNLDAIERLAIERALAATGGNRTRAARLLGISERTLRNKLNSPRAASGD